MEPIRVLIAEDNARFRDGLRALLHDARGEVRVVTESQWFSDDAHVIPWIQLQMTGLENSYVAEMNVHLARWRLKNHMRADRRRARGGLEFYDRAEKKTFAIHVVGVQSRRVGLLCLLGVRRNGKHQDDQEPFESA